MPPAGQSNKHPISGSAAASGEGTRYGSRAKRPGRKHASPGKKAEQ